MKMYFRYTAFAMLTVFASCRQEGYPTDEEIHIKQVHRIDENTDGQNQNKASQKKGDEEPKKDKQQWIVSED